MIHGIGHYYDECNALGGFVNKYDAAQPTKDSGSNPIPRKIFHKNNKTTLLSTMWWIRFK